MLLAVDRIATSGDSQVLSMLPTVRKVASLQRSAGIYKTAVRAQPHCQDAMSAFFIACYVMSYLAQLPVQRVPHDIAKP